MTYVHKNDLLFPILEKMILKYEKYRTGHWVGITYDECSDLHNVLCKVSNSDGFEIIRIHK